jgi:hypothetical protein
MAFPGSTYAPPGVYTQTFTEDPVRGLAESVRIPLIIGPGSEILSQSALEIVRGSSSTVDQRVVQEDEAGRAVVDISAAGAVTRGDFNGSYNRLQVKHFPIVSGDGTGTTATSSSSVNVTVNGSPVVVLAIDGAKGVLTLSVSPEATDEVLVTYFFNRTDTLITDTVSDQISPDAPELYGQVSQKYDITTDVNDSLSFLVDDANTVSVTISASPSGGWTAAQVAAFINSAATGTSLSASTAVNNLGDTVIYLTADRNIEVGSGSANTTLGLSSGDATNRNKVFYTFQRPIVDGTNGGVTTTSPSDVTVLVDNVQVIPTAVDGQSGAVTLPIAPEVGVVVTIRYYFNSWQDTFDYLANRGITDVTLCGVTPDRNDYVESSDFVLKDDKILWGTAVTIESGEYTTGGTVFTDTQVSATLVDVRQYLAECSAVVNTSVNPPSEGRLEFTLPLQPTTGNGRDTPLSSETYSEVANGRVDLPTNRPDLVWAYWGYSVEDALDRGRVEVTKVESSTSTITLAEPVPVGATVYATFYYNTLVDQEYSVECVTAGASGVGTYTLKNEAGSVLPTPQFSSKGAALASVTVEFPSGSERTPDCRFEAPFDATSLTGAVEEDVTVTFASQDATIAKYTVPGPGPYFPINGQSDSLDVNIDNGATAATDLGDPTGNGTGFRATMVGGEISYDADSGNTTYDIDATNNAVDLEIDGILVQAMAEVAAGVDAASYVSAINRAAFGDWDNGGVALALQAAGSTTSITLDATASGIDDYYVGWTIRLVTATGTTAIGDTAEVLAYNGTTKVATLDAGFGGNTPGAAEQYVLYNEGTLPAMKGSTRFLAPLSIAAGAFDDINFRIVGADTVDCTGAAAATIAPSGATPYTASTLAVEVQSKMQAAVDAAWAALAGPPDAGLSPLILAEADSNGRIAIKVIPQSDTPANLGAVLEFVSDASAGGNAEEDFCVLAGFDIAGSGGAQAKLHNDQIATHFEIAGPPALAGYDRILLTNRITPGQATDSEFVLGQCQLKVLGGTGADQAGLTANEEAEAGIRATVMEPTLFGEVGLAGGQDVAGNPVVTFYAAGGTTPQNNVFKFTFDGTPVTVEFLQSDGTTAIPPGGSADVPLTDPSGAAAGPIITQINSAMSAAGLAATAIQEGAGIRFRGGSSASAASIVIGTGSANSALGFGDGDVAYRSDLSVETLVSGLMAASAFSAAGLAKTVSDGASAKYLYVQSQGAAGAGTTSSVAFEASTALRPGVGLGITAGDGNVGESAVDGFYVTSSDTVSGSGTANTSVLNTGTGQDGIVGQTYRDSVTGLTFTILPRAGGAAYPTGGTSTITFSVRNNVTTDSNLPVNTLPGVELYVANTSGVTAGDMAIVQTYEKGGNQPSVGDVYYVSYEYQKQGFSTQLFTKLSTVEASYGPKSTEYPVSLASYLSILNGAVIVAVKQVRKDTDTDADGVSDDASVDAYIAAIDDVEGALPGGSFPSYIIPLRGDSLTLYQYLAKHCDIQSSIRYRAERTAICGLSAGTQPREAGDMAQAIARSRFRLLYPDIATLSISRADGNTDTYLVDGTYVAAAWAGNRAAPTIDVATPWTRGRLVGFDDLARTLDPVQQNQVAVKGLSVFAQRQRIIECRHGLTTDMTNVLTKTPTVITIADEVQQQARVTLDRFVGQKFLDGVTTQIEGQLSATLKNLVKAQIINAFTGVSAITSPDDPTVAEVEAYYQPVFPLLYIVVTFNLRSSL